MADLKTALGLKRKQFFVDPKFQGALVVRVGLYWVFTLFAVTLMLLCGRIIAGPARIFYTHFDDMWFHYGPALVASVILLPIVLLDVVRVSNRLVGPLVRLRSALRAQARGEHVKPLVFREGDYWREFADEFNLLVARVRRAERELELQRSEETTATATENQG